MDMFGFQRYLEDLEESIYPPCHTQTSRYRSRFAQKVRVDTWCQKSGCYNTMGPPREYCEKPEHFLRKFSRLPPVFINHLVLPSPEVDVLNGRPGESEERRNRLGLGAPSTKIERGERDFLEENALRVIRIPSRRIKRCYNGVDGSHRVDISDGPFILQPGFGQVPDYIQQRKCELYYDAQRLKREMEDAQIPSNCRIMSHCERCSLINGLKARWDELSMDYLRLPAYSSDWVDKQKSQLEHELNEIEGDLKLLTSSGPIFISQNIQPSNF